MEKEIYDLSQLSIQECLDYSEYYVIVRETILIKLSGTCIAHVCKGEPGMLLKAVKDKIDNSALRVKVYNETNDEIGHNTEWKCAEIDALHVSEIFWNLLCAIDSFSERKRIIDNKPLCEDVNKLDLNSKVWYCPGFEHLNTYLANIEYIGPVQERGNGYFFGLDILQVPEICKPDPLIKKYFESFKSSGVITILSNISPRKSNLEDIERFEKNFIYNDDVLQTTKKNNLFSIKNEEHCTTKKNSHFIQNNKCSLQVDNDNNNQSSEPNNPNHYNFINDYYPKKSETHEQQNDKKKLYINLKSFDPLNSDEADEASENFQQSSKNSNNINNQMCYGVIRSIGPSQLSNSEDLIAAIELDNSHELATDGTYQGVKYIQYDPHKTWLTDLQKCEQFEMAASSCYYRSEIPNYKSNDSSVISESVPPISVKGDLEKICGKLRGIQGHHNSCYLDATLFSMFAFTDVFDHLLFRPRNKNDCLQYDEVQRVLREEIVNPLRRNLFVEAHRVMKLRTLLEKSSSISGLTSEEKDPEEFLTSLVAQTLKADPFLKLSSGQDAYHYQLFVEKDDKLILPTVQQLLDQSFLTSNVRLKEVPTCLIIQMPRFGKSYKMYSKIQPTLLLDVTDIIEDSQRQCIVCGELAQFECKDCYGQIGKGIESTAFCEQCLKGRVHRHDERRNHKPKALTSPMKYEILKKGSAVPRLCMELLAVVCIETSHYVSFVKCAAGTEAPWCFFDSMADRKGEQNGYNIPEMVPCPDFPYLLSEEGAQYLITVKDDKSLPEYAKRLLCDAYMCMYQSPDNMTYK